MKIQPTEGRVGFPRDVSPAFADAQEIKRNRKTETEKKGKMGKMGEMGKRKDAKKMAEFLRRML